MGTTDRRFAKTPRLPNDAYTDPEAAFHFVIRAFPDTRPFRGGVAEEVWRAILTIDHNGTAIPLAACLMPDHLHLMLKPGATDLRAAVANLKSYTTRMVRPLGVRRLWQPSYFDRRVRNGSEFENTLHYVVNNPVEAGLVREPEQWTFTKVW